MNIELKKHIAEENKYYDLLESNPKYRLQGRDSKINKVVIGVVKGNPEEYRETDHLNFKYFDTWKEAYVELN